MSVHSTHYDDLDEYERDLAYEYRQGNEEDVISFWVPCEEDLTEEDIENE